MSYQTPLAVYIVWHPDFNDGQGIADQLYSTLCRDTSKPLIRTIGIPVYYRQAKLPALNHPLPVDFNESERIAVIALVDDKFVLDEAYRNYLDSILVSCSEDSSSRRLFPVAISHAARQITSNLEERNFILISEKHSPFDQMKTSVLHELCRLLMGMKKATDERESDNPTPPVKLFISHSKHDDSKVEAEKLRDFIYANTQLKAFFDANDIPVGSSFGDEIRRAARSCALVAFQSDTYAEREWCRIEVLEAKREGCPVVVVNAVQSREQRTFPYIGNYPSVRYSSNNLHEIIDLALAQVLLKTYSELHLVAIANMYDVKHRRILSSSPELFNFIQLRKDGLTTEESYGLVIYPDPPLGSEEMELLNELDNDFVFVTPIALPSLLK